MKATARGLAKAAAVFAALGDPTRLAVVARLASEGPQPIVRLTERAEVSRQAVTKHLDVLEAAGLVRSRRDGRERVWEVQPARLDEVRRLLADISSQWDEALARLRAAVEEDDA